MVQVYTDIGDHDLEVHWGSVSEAVEDSLKMQAKTACSENQHHVDNNEWGSHWVDKRSAEWMTERLQSPDPGTMTKVLQFRDRLNNSNPELVNTARRRRRVRNLEHGAEFNTSRYVEGAELCFEEMRKVSRPARVARIGIDYTISCMGQREDLLPRGAALMALCDWLCANGYSVELVGMWYVKAFKGSEGRDNPKYSWCTVVMKQSSTPFDLGSLVTSACEIAFVRKIALCGMVAHAPWAVQSGYGQCKGMPEKQQIAMGYDALMPQEIDNEAAANDWLKRMLVKFGERG